MIVDISIPEKFVRLAGRWAGDTDCMLRAVSSTGGLTLGTNRPYNDDIGRYLTDEEWQVALWGSLECDVAYNRRLAEKSSDPRTQQDAKRLAKFEEFAERITHKLRTKYALEDSEAV